MRKLLLFAAMAIAGVSFASNVWKIDVEANSDTIPNFSREFSRGESWEISPLITDDGVPRVWNTNVVFRFFWQKPNMLTNWWASTNVIFPVYRAASIDSTSPVITKYITNTTWITYPTTNSSGTTNTLSYTNTFTTYIASHTTSNVVDTGRVSAVWCNEMDAGANSYNWFIAGYEGSTISLRVNGTIIIRGSPGVGGSFIGNPLTWPWATTNFVTNLFNQVSAYSLRVVTNGAPAGYFFLQTPVP